MTSVTDVTAFLAAMSKVMKFTEKSPVLSLEGVKVEFQYGCCQLSATNLERWAFADIISTGEPFSFLLCQTKQVSKMLKGLSGRLSITFLPDEKNPRVQFACDGRSGSFSVYSGEDFPMPPEVEEEQRYRIHPAELGWRVNRVSYATDVRSDRPAAKGVRFMGDTLFCLDGYRMAVSRNKDLSVNRPFVLPADIFKHWHTFFPMGMGELTVGKHLASITMPGLELRCRLILPDEFTPEKVMPTTYTDRFILSPKVFGKELAYLSEFVKNPFKEPIRFRDGMLSVNTDAGIFTAEIPIEGRSEVEFGFHVRYMQEAMISLQNYDRITVEVSSPIGPIVLRGDEESYALVLPIRLREKNVAA